MIRGNHEARLPRHEINRHRAAFMEHDKLIALAASDPLIGAILQAQIAEVQRLYGPVLGHTRGFLIETRAEGETLSADITIELPGDFIYDRPEEVVYEIPIDYIMMGTGDMVQVDVHAADVKKASEQWERIEVAAAKDLVWDSNEEITEPGVGRREEPAFNSTAAFPRLVKAPGPVRCYLCALNSPYALQRSANDVEMVCPNCVYTHLGYEVQSDGHLTKRPVDTLKLHP